MYLVMSASNMDYDITSEVRDTLKAAQGYMEKEMEKYTGYKEKEMSDFSGSIVFPNNDILYWTIQHVEGKLVPENTVCFSGTLPPDCRSCQLAQVPYSNNDFYCTYLDQDVTEYKGCRHKDCPFLKDVPDTEQPWASENWYEDDLENALLYNQVEPSKTNIAWLKQKCLGMFDDKSVRNEAISDKAYELFCSADELAYELPDGKGYFVIQECCDHFDYSVYDDTLHLLDCGQIDAEMDCEDNIFDIAKMELEERGLWSEKLKIVDYDSLEVSE